MWTEGFLTIQSVQVPEPATLCRANWHALCRFHSLFWPSCGARASWEYPQSRRTAARHLLERHHAITVCPARPIGTDGTYIALGRDVPA
jgi:hypothetical protein